MSPRLVRLALAAVLPVSVAAGVLFTPQTAHASTTPLRLKAFHWARANEKGCWYHYGSAGPCRAGYDCSGAVQRAYSAVGISLPRTVAGMKRSWHLVRIRPGQARKGNLVIWGDFHVEFVAYLTRWTFGAHHSGTRVGTVRTWSYPHTYWRVR